MAGPLGCDQLGQQRGHRRSLVGEDPDIALRAGQGERFGQACHRVRILAHGGERQRPQCPGLDDTAGPILGHRGRVQPVQQRQRLTGPALGEQHARQHQVLGLRCVAGLVLGAEAVLFRPADGSVHVALGQQQPGPLCRDGIERSGGIWRGLHGLFHRGQGSGRISAGLPDPGQHGQAECQRRGVDELPA
jgi:hypothetical protein